MKTLQIGLDWFPERAGGLPRYYFDLVNCLPDMGVEVRGLVAGTPAISRWTNGSMTAFAPREAAAAKKLIRARRAFAHVSQEFQPDLIASHFAYYTLPCLGLIRRPLVVHFHGPWGSESGVEGASRYASRAKSFVEQAVYRRADRFIVLSGAFAGLLSREYGIPEQKIEVIPGGIDVNRFVAQMPREMVRRTLGWPLDRPILIAVRRLARRMGVETLIEAMREVVRRVPDALLYIGGRGPLADEFQAQVGAAGLEAHVTLLGYIPDDLLPLCYQAADASVVPTTALEGFGLICAESLAAGTPVFVTPIGGLPEVVSGLAPDMIFEDTSAGAIAQRISCGLLGQIALPDRAACEAYARAKFDWSIAAPNVKRVYEDVLS